MKSVIIMASLALCITPAFAQTGSPENDTVLIPSERCGTVLLHAIGLTRIYFKDGTIKKNCLIKEIQSQWIVYMKDKTLHDAAIDKIRKIEFPDQLRAIYFDEKNKPFIGAVR